MDLLRSALHRLAAHGVPPSELIACRLTVALDRFLNQWRTETLPFLQAGGSELRFIEAPYGRGKTHCLHVLSKAARDAGFAVGVVQCSAESKPFQSPQETYGAVVRALRFPVTHAADDGQPDSKKLLETLADLSSEQRSLLRRFPGITTAYRNVLFSYAQANAKPFPNRGVLDGLAGLVVPEAGTAVSVPELFRYDHTLQRPLGKLGKRTALPWLHGLLRLPRALGNKGIVLFFDETGADLHLSRESVARKREHLAHLRNLVDHLGVGSLPGVGIVYAAAADLVTTAREILPPLAQRIERIDISRINPRAVWCTLDELTHPTPGNAEFYVALGQRILDLGRDAGVSEDRLKNSEARVSLEAERFSRSIRDSSVRDFTKFVATVLISS